MLEASLAARLQRAAHISKSLDLGQQRIADALGASQSQVSRILSGRPVRWSRLAEDVCLYVERQSDGGVSTDAVRANDDLIGAIQAVWNGSASHARALSTVIRSLAVLHGPIGEEVPNKE